MLVSFQIMIDKINLAIGANSVISEQCKTVVTSIGNTIFKLLSSSVNTSYTHTSEFP